MSCGTLVPAGCLRVSLTGLSPSLEALSNALLLPYLNAFMPARNPREHAPWFGLFPFRSPLLRKSMFLSLPPGTEMFQFPGCPSMELWIHSMMAGHYPSRVSPFGYLRINACLRLLVAFRSLPRPSSAYGALASTLCSYSLDFFVDFLLRPIFSRSQ